MGAHLTLVNLTSRLRRGRGRAGGFLSGCPFSTAPFVVAMAPPRSLARSARVRAGSGLGGAQPARGVTAPRRFMERPTPPARGGRLIGCRTRGREGGRAGGEGAGPPHPTPPAALAGSRPPPARPPRRALPRPGGCPWRSSRSAAGPRKSAGSGSGPGQGAGSRGVGAAAPGSLPDVPRSGEFARGTCRPLPAAAPRTHQLGSARCAREGAPAAGDPAPRPGSGPSPSLPARLGRESGRRVPNSRDGRPPRPHSARGGTVGRRALGPADPEFPRALGLHTPRGRRRRKSVRPAAPGPLTFTGAHSPPARGPGMQFF